MTELTPEETGSNPVDTFFAIPMLLLSATYPLFRLGSDGFRRTVGWPVYEAGLAFTVAGLLYCAWSRQSPRAGGIASMVAATVAGVLTYHNYGPPPPW
ncbi:hypothetical protein SAMN05216371_7054 [Streptomyces sp. TLI_053]|uniref:hypothetical protein n=1 Tax=Streptomyces sp. TLI_053 TaxID=1855352 RepID=UPI00087B0794|nr:hypothetical protein [Streptomyces sp. TLI_053]SDT82258.1 hypothetical protein SAMN05216371_7054 [Streptomyces sp. TLI_053]